MPIGECATSTLDFVEDTSSYIYQCNSTHKWYHYWNNVTNCQPSKAYEYQAVSPFDAGYTQCKPEPACNIGKVTGYHDLEDKQCTDVYSKGATEYNYAIPMVLNTCINATGNDYSSEGIWYRYAKCDYQTNTIYVMDTDMEMRIVVIQYGIIHTQLNVIIIRIPRLNVMVLILMVCRI